jgi:hypothetical protein
MQGSIPMQKMRVLTSTDNNAGNSSSSIPPVIGLAYQTVRNVLISCGGKDDRRLTFYDMNSQKAYRIIQATYEGELKAIGIR